MLCASGEAFDSVDHLFELKWDGTRGLAFVDDAGKARIVNRRRIDITDRYPELAADDGEVPVVMSGDGLIGQVGGALAGTETPLGIIPGGRGNDLARVLGIPSEPAGAVRLLAEGNERQIDVGEANGRRFLCIASFGFDSECNRIANETKLVRGNLVYAYSVPRALAAWRPATFEFTIVR